MKTRAERRARKEAEKKKAVRFLRDVWHVDAGPVGAGKRARTRVACSCPMCGNPRRAPGSSASRLTLQERRAALDFGD